MSITPSQATSAAPPIVKQIPHEYTVHGKTLVDNYHWLRESSWPKQPKKEILDYLKKENAYTEAWFKPLKTETDRIYKEIIGRIQLKDQSIPTKSRNYYYSSITKETSKYARYVRRKTPTGKDKTIFDGDKEAKGHDYFSIGGLSISPSENLIAYSLDTKGDEYYMTRIRDLDTGKEMEDVLTRMHGGGVTWDELNQGFYYTKMDDQWRPMEVYYHKLGTKQAKDKLIYKELDQTFGVSVGKTSDDKYILVSPGSSTTTEVQYISSTDPNQAMHMLVPRKEDHLCSIDHINGFWYVTTNDKGKNFRLVRASGEKVREAALRTKDYEELIAHSDKSYLTDVDLYDNLMVVETREKGLPRIALMTYDMKPYDSIKFPDKTYEAGAAYSDHDDDGIFVGYSSLSSPSKVFRYNFKNKTMTVVKVQKIPSGYDESQYACDMVWAPSRDGKTLVPISLVYKKDLFKQDGSNPLLLYGYGSYGHAVSKSFRTGILSLVNRGFVYAIAHIRGGDDLGFKWYEDAKFLNKKLTFEDFIDSADFLVKKKYTSAGNIAIEGRSAGGMLVGTAVNARPDLFKAALVGVPFVDVLNTMLDETLPLTPGEFKEWGNPKDAKFFEYILSYSPYENVQPQNYPAMYVKAGLNDPRVTYWEPAKWVAKLRATKTDNRVLLLETEMGAGHGGKTGRFDRIKEVAREYAFLVKVFGLDSRDL